MSTTLTFQTGTALKYVEEDSYKEGCNPDTAETHMVEVELVKPTLAELIEEVKSYWGVTDDDIMLDSCEEPGRLDIQIMENEMGTTASNAEIEQWKTGKLRLWSACYTYHIQMVTKTTIPLTA